MTSQDSRIRALACVEYALDRKAYDLVLLKVGELTSLADYFLICTGRSDTQVQAIAQSVEDNMARAWERPLSTEGYSNGQWIILDYGDIIIHVFNEPVREFYDIERLWAKAPRVELPEPYQSQVRDLRLAQEAR